MGMKIVGSLNLGFALIGLNYLLSWILAIVYGRIDGLSALLEILPSVEKYRLE
jgi:hypothetical protein